jgi:predicted porin
MLVVGLLFIPQDAKTYRYFKIYGNLATVEKMMKKKLITLAVSAALAAPAAAFAEATIYGKLNNSIDYVDVEQNAQMFGPGSIPYTKVPNNPTLPDNVFASYGLVDGEYVPVGVERVAGGAGVDWTAPASGELYLNGGDNGSEYLLKGEQIVNGVLPNGTLVKSAQDYKGWDLNANTRNNRIGVKGSEDLGGGLKAIYQVELQVALSDEDGYIADGELKSGNNNAIKMRNSFVGLAGDWGTLLVGRHDTPEKIATSKLDLFSDTLADYNSTLGFANVRADNTVLYISPSFSGFQFAGAVIPAGGATATEGWGVPGDSPDGIADSWSVAGIYSNGPFFASVSYETLDSNNWSAVNEDLYVDGVLQTDYYGIPNYGSADDWSYWKIGLGLLDWNGFTLTGIYESHSNVLGAPQDSDMDIWQIQAAYSFGNETIKGMYGQNSPDSCVGSLYAATCSSAITSETGVPVSDLAYLNNRDYSSWAIGFDHNFSKRTTAYALYTATDSDQKSSDWSGFSLGLIHKF